GTWRVSAIPPGRPPLPLSRNLERSLRSPALWRRGEVQLDCLAAGTRARLDGELSGVGLKDQRRDLFGAVDADPSAEQPAARAIATRLVRCQSEARAHLASTLAAARRAVDHIVADIRGTGRYGLSGLSQLHCGLMPADLITLAHLSVSSAMSLPKSAGEPVNISLPSSAIRAFTVGSATAALTSRLSRSTIPAGVPLGTPMPSQPVTA